MNTHFISPFNAIAFSLLYASKLAMAQSLKPVPPIFMDAPVPKYDDMKNPWCSTTGLEATTGPLIRLGVYLFWFSIFTARAVAPSSQPQIVLMSSIVTIVLSVILLMHTASQIYPVALELYLVAFPAWLLIASSRPLALLKLVSHMNLGLSIMSFITQTVAVFLLASTQIHISTLKNRARGMDFRWYEITRNRNKDLVPDPNSVEYLYTGQRLCGRYAVFGANSFNLEGTNYNNFMMASGVLLIFLWLIIMGLWARQLLIYLYVLRRPAASRNITSRINIRDTLPVLPNLQDLFREGDLPARYALLKDTYEEVGLREMRKGWGKWARDKLSLQMVVLEKSKRRFLSDYGLSNKTNHTILINLIDITLFILIVVNNEQTVKKWKILYGNETTPHSKEGWSSDITAGGSNGILVLTMGLTAIVSVIVGCLGEIGIWRVFYLLGEQIRKDRGPRHLI